MGDFWLVVLLASLKAALEFVRVERGYVEMQEAAYFVVGRCDNDHREHILKHDDYDAVDVLEAEIEPDLLADYIQNFFGRLELEHFLVVDYERRYGYQEANYPDEKY